MTLTLALGQEHKGVSRTSALTSDQARTEQTQVTIRARDISAPLFSEEGRERGRERAGEETSRGGLAQLAQLFRSKSLILVLIDRGDRNTVLKEKELTSPRLKSMGMFGDHAIR